MIKLNSNIKHNYISELKLKQVVHFLLFVLVLCLTPSCNKEKKIMEENEATILEYLENQNLSAEKTSSGLYYRIVQEGNGEFPSVANTVTVNYRGYFTDGSTFDENDDISFPLNAVILGWQEGIPLISKGGSASLFIPSHLGYGSNPPPGIPADEVLIFDVDLLDF